MNSAAQKVLSMVAALVLLIATGGAALGDSSHHPGAWDDIVNPSILAQDDGLTAVVAVAAGGRHSLAVKSDGTVWAWGSNLDGQLGDDTTTDRHRPVQVESGILGMGR
jgi:hypothetical protein